MILHECALAFSILSLIKTQLFHFHLLFLPLYVPVSLPSIPCHLLSYSQVDNLFSFNCYCCTHAYTCAHTDPFARVCKYHLEVLLCCLFLNRQATKQSGDSSLRQANFISLSIFLVLCLQVGPHDIPDRFTVIDQVLFLQPLLRKTVSQETAWYFGSQHMSAPILRCSLSQRSRICAEDTFIGSGLTTIH